MKARPIMDYHTDEGSWALGCVILTLFAILCIYCAAPAHSQESPPNGGCIPSVDLDAQLQKQYGETVTAGGVLGPQGFMYITTNPRTHTFTILVRRPDGMSCVALAGEGFALADASRMKGPGL